MWAPKRRKLNPLGEDVYLNPDGTVTRDEDKIIAAQRIFIHNYYSPNGRWFIEKKESWGQQASSDFD
jgi:hypothetical protein